MISSVMLDIIEFHKESCTMCTTSRTHRTPRTVLNWLFIQKMGIWDNRREGKIKNGAFQGGNYSR